MSNRLRVGVVGANGENDRWGAKAHVPAIAALEELELVAVATSHEDSARKAQERSGARLAFSNYHDLVKSADIDLVTVSVKISMHHPIVLDALKAKKHVFCEWPLALDSTQGIEMLNSAENSGLKHAVATQSRFSPGLLFMKQLVDDGEIGDPLFFSLAHHLNSLMTMPSHRWWLLQSEQGGGVILIATGHALDIARWILGDVTAVCGRADTFTKEIQFTDTKEIRPVLALDTACFGVQMSNGIMGTASTSISARGGGGFRFEIQGTKGRLVAETNGMVQYSTARVWKSTGLGEIQELEVPDSLTGVKGLDSDSAEFHIAQELRAFTASIRNGQAFTPGFEEGVSLHKIIEALKRAFQSSSWESVEA